VDESKNLGYQRSRHGGDAEHSHSGQRELDLPVPGAWTAYTPAWTSDGTAPNTGSPTGKYFRSGNLVVAQIALTTSVGGGNWGTGGWYFSLPATAVSTITTGTGFITDTSSGNPYVVHSNFNTTTTVAVYTSGAIATKVGLNNPFTWASGDVLNLTHIYEAA
jgi:hypothetical protein